VTRQEAHAHLRLAAISRVAPVNAAAKQAGPVLRGGGPAVLAADPAERRIEFPDGLAPVRVPTPCW